MRPRCRQRGLEQGVRGRHYLRLAPRALDLIGVLVGVARIDAQPVLCSVTAAFRMSAYDAPVCVGHTVDGLREVAITVAVLVDQLRTPLWVHCMPLLFGAADRNRTRNLLFTKRLLCQLSCGGVVKKERSGTLANRPEALA